MLKLSDQKFHGPVFFLARGNVVINGAIDLSGDNSPGPAQSLSDARTEFAGSGGYTGGLGGLNGDSNHQAQKGNGPGGGNPGVPGGAQAQGGSFTANHNLQPIVGGSGGGGWNGGDLIGGQGGAGAGALLIASSGTIRLDGGDGAQIQTLNDYNGRIEALGGAGAAGSGGGAGGAVRLVADSIVGTNNYFIQVDGGGNGQPGAPGLIRLETNNIGYNPGNVTGAAAIVSAPFDLNPPTTPTPVIRVVSVDGKAVNSNPAQFPSVTINSQSAVPVVISATNVPLTWAVTLYVISDQGPNRSFPVTLEGSEASSHATVSVPFPPVGSLGFVKAVVH